MGIAVHQDAAVSHRALVAFHCEHCHRTLGYTDEQYLIMGEAAFDQTVTITHKHPDCGKKTIWHPARKK